MQHVSDQVSSRVPERKLMKQRLSWALLTLLPCVDYTVYYTYKIYIIYSLDPARPVQQEVMPSFAVGAFWTDVRNLQQIQQNRIPFWWGPKKCFQTSAFYMVLLALLVTGLSTPFYKESCCQFSLVTGSYEQYWGLLYQPIWRMPRFIWAPYCSKRSQA